MRSLMMLDLLLILNIVVQLIVVPTLLHLILGEHHLLQSIKVRLHRIDLLLSFFAVARLRLAELANHIVELVPEFVLLLVEALVDLLLEELWVILEVFEHCILEVRFFYPIASEEKLVALAEAIFVD